MAFNPSPFLALKGRDLDLEDSDIDELLDLFEKNDVFPYLDKDEDDEEDYYGYYGEDEEDDY